jgi:uncharacterized protein (DUF2267 family)
VYDRNKGGRIFRSVLQAMRDRVTPDQASNFASQLPIIWKGIYFDGYQPADTPVRARTIEEWADLVRYKNEYAAQEDFPTLDHVMSALRCVVNALSQLMAFGSVDKFLQAFPLEIQDYVYAEDPAPFIEGV